MFLLMKDQATLPYHIIIIGSGYSGTLVAIHLARMGCGLRIALVERGEAVGRGVAYSTVDYKHLLNVQADQMGAFPDDIGHFFRWLQTHPENLAAAGIAELLPDAFIPRRIFGDYLQDLLQQTREKTGAIDILRDEIISLTQGTDSRFQLTGKTGLKLEAERVVLALGNFPPGEAKNEANPRPWYFNNPYDPHVHAQLAEPGDILIIGTGLTSLDLLLTLDKTKREGKIHLLARRGLFPQPHHKAEPYPPFIDPENAPRTTRALCRLVHEELRHAAALGIDWRPVLDAIRPHNQALWKALEAKEQRRFLRHLRALWDTHRHRCAPEIMAVKERLQAEGRLVLHQGHIRDYHPTTDGVRVTYRPRGTTAEKEMPVRYVLSCTGPQADYRKLNDPLVQNLLAHDLLAPDPLHMGANTVEGGFICNHADQPIAGLYTLGSTQKGRLYESIAVPELRTQAADLARRLIENEK